MGGRVNASSVPRSGNGGSSNGSSKTPSRIQAHPVAAAPTSPSIPSGADLGRALVQRPRARSALAALDRVDGRERDRRRVARHVEDERRVEKALDRVPESARASERERDGASSASHQHLVEHRPPRGAGLLSARDAGLRAHMCQPESSFCSHAALGRVARTTTRCRRGVISGTRSAMTARASTGCAVADRLPVRARASRAVARRAPSGCGCVTLVCSSPK